MTLTQFMNSPAVAFWISMLAIAVGVVGIWRAEALFRKLDHTLEQLITNLKANMLKETETVFASYTSFVRALQAVDLDPHELPQDGAFALMTVFRLKPNLP